MKMYGTRKKVVSLSRILALPLSLYYNEVVVCAFSFTSRRDKSLLNDRVLYRICAIARGVLLACLFVVGKKRKCFCKMGL
jgi:hypothetical protein